MELEYPIALATCDYMICCSLFICFRKMNQTIDNNLKAISNRTSKNSIGYSTFSKRRSGLYKKASQLVRENDVDLGIVLTSPTDKVYAFVHPTSNAVIDRFINLKTDFGDRFVAENSRDKVNQLNDRLNEFDKREEIAKESLLALNEMDKTREKSLGVHRSVKCR
ncbi:agamous-like MADS-box protein AGL29 [Capsicum annuum]|uniref:agamous-like MADS-box protein AGL29 n=1 Tax=Capsicum annuum TaxID=4072 RepID=UPI001FB064EF|nr:agamous-like MADS-box protein AGL29 [Capsicum annuum]